jgi:hypothetical protein
MKYTLIGLALWFGTVGFAGGPNMRVNTASNNLGSAYTAVFPQLTLTGLVAKSHFGIVNGTGSEICCNLVTPSPINPPTSGNDKEQCFPANSYALVDFTPISANVYCRSFSGTISSGVFSVWTW